MTITFSAVSRRLYGLMLLAAMPALSQAQKTNQKLPIDPEVATGKLSNGLTYYVRNNHKPANKVELRLVVKAGSILENNEQLGLAHFMEHMNFNGTKNFQKNDLVSYLQSIGVQFGADLNAYTAFDQTVYILPIPTDNKDNLDKGFQIIEDWAHNALLTDKDIDEERAVVLEESRLGKGADDRMLKKYFPKLAEGSLYAERLPIGKDEILKNFKYPAIRSYYADWYRPDLQAVIVVGDIDTATAKAMVVKHFGQLTNPAGEKARKYVDVVSRKAPEAMVVTDKEATNASLAIMYPYKKKHESATLADYKSDIERGLALAMLNRRFNDLAQSGNPPFPFAAAGFDDLIHGYESFNVFTIFSDNPKKAMTALTGELVRAKKYGFTAQELNLAKKDMMSGMEKSYNERKTTESKDYVEEYIRAFLNNEAFPGLENEHKYYSTLIPAISLADINGMASEWIKDQNTFTLITAPEKGVTLPDEATLLDMTKTGLAQNIEETKEKELPSSLLPSPPPVRKAISTKKEEGLDAVTYTFENGIQVTVKQTDFKSDEILLSGVKKGGESNYDIKDKNNVHFATSGVEAMGYGIFNPTMLEKMLAGKEVKLKAGISDITDDVEGSSTVKDFETMLQLLYLEFVFPREEVPLFEAYRQKQIAMTQYTMANPQAAFFDTTVKVLYGNNPLARIVIPKPADYQYLDPMRMLEIYRQEFNTGNGFHFYITGNIKPEDALPMLEMYIGSIPFTNKVPSFKDNGVRRVKGVKELKIHKGTEKQSIILAVYSGDVKYSEDLALKTQAVAEVLNIKVIEDLREKMGGIYTGGFAGNVSKEPYESYSIQLQLPCGPENVDKLLAAAKEEIKNLKAKGPDAKDLEKVKSQWREKHITDVKENKYWTSKMQSILFWGKDKDRVLNYQSYIDKLTPADIQNTAKLLFDGKNEFISILYPES